MTDHLTSRAQRLIEEFDEFAVYWWGPETDERSVEDVIQCGGMAVFARDILARWGRAAIEPETDHD